MAEQNAKYLFSEIVDTQVLKWHRLPIEATVGGILEALCLMKALLKHELVLCDSICMIRRAKTQCLMEKSPEQWFPGRWECG